VIEKYRREHPEVEPSEARDLRRSFKTLCGKAGIDRTMADRLQNHTKGDVGFGHYDRYDYLPGKRAAMAMWSDFLDRVIKGEDVEEPAPEVMMETVEVPEWVKGDWRPPEK